MKRQLCRIVSRFRHRAALLIACFVSMLVATPVSGRPAETREKDEQPLLLFTSFRGGGDGLHLALSHDGYKWKALKNDKPFLRSGIGSKALRDPCLAQGPDGNFHLVWTSGPTPEGKKAFGYSTSADLIRWAAPRHVVVMQNDPATRNVWAPDLFYDEARQRWLIFWSSTVPGKFPDSDSSGDSGFNHRIYYTTTKDFKTFGESKLYYDPGFNCIDATLFRAGDKFYLFFKDERKKPLKKNLRYAVASSPEGPFGAPSEPFTGDWVEGPSVLRLGEWTYVYFDHYSREHYYGAVRSRDLKQWQDVSRQMTFPRDHRHGTVLRISKETAAVLQAQE